MSDNYVPVVVIKQKGPLERINRRDTTRDDATKKAQRKASRRSHTTTCALTLKIHIVNMLRNMPYEQPLVSGVRTSDREGMGEGSASMMQHRYPLVVQDF